MVDFTLWRERETWYVCIYVYIRMSMYMNFKIVSDSLVVSISFCVGGGYVWSMVYRSLYRRKPDMYKKILNDLERFLSSSRDR